MIKIDHLILNVNDVGSSIDFYVNVLGFQLEGEVLCTKSKDATSTVPRAQRPDATLNKEIVRITAEN
jgi:hypothetical protein